MHAVLSVAVAITGNTSHKWALDDSLITHIWLLQGDGVRFVSKVVQKSKAKAKHNRHPVQRGKAAVAEGCFYFEGFQLD